jgi:hypothetical protein
MSCCNASQNKTCPSKMNDGRSFTDYRPKCISNSEFMYSLDDKNIIASSYESRLYLQHNAEEIMEQLRSTAEKNLMCGVCPVTNPGTMLPERYVISCDGVTCQRKEIDPNGLGDGRQY